MKEAAVATGSTGFHEAADDLRPETKDRHRAVVSLQEELEAIDWYTQRIDAAGDVDLREILRYNRDDEKEHAAMLLEWVRRQDPVWDEELRRYLFTDGPIAGLAPEEGAGGEDTAAASPSLGVGSLADKETL
jgi:ferritin-like protein